MKKFFEWLRGIMPDDSVLSEAYKERDFFIEKSFTLATKLKASEEKAQAIAHDYAIELRLSADNQLQADIFQQALTNTFDAEQIKSFFDNADKIRIEHETNAN